jgi:VanZ family protein
MMRASIAVNLIFMLEVYWDVSRRLPYMLALLVLAGLLLFAPLPIAPTYLGRTIENAGHTPLFFLVTIGLLFTLREIPRFAGARLYAIAGLVGAGTGFLSEVVQRPLSRDASWEDVAADALGALLALAAYALFERRSNLKRRDRVGALLIAISCIAIFIAPIVRMARAYVHRNGQFPVLADFHSRIELYWTMSVGVNRRIVDNALEVDFVADEFPGVSFHEPVPDWRQYKTLVIDLQNPDAEPLSLVVRVHDRPHRHSFHDRFNRRYELAAGERRTLKIPLEDIRRAPRGRPMDMANISDVTLFKRIPKGSRRLRVYLLRLE